MWVFLTGRCRAGLLINISGVELEEHYRFLAQDWQLSSVYCFLPKLIV